MNELWGDRLGEGVGEDTTWAAWRSVVRQGVSGLGLEACQVDLIGDDAADALSAAQ